jgi:chemotaxis protein methyltransferase CheR
MMQNAQQPEAINIAASGGPVLREADLRRVSEFVGEEVGIQLPNSKRTMVEGRLRKRLRTLGFDDFKGYLNFTLNTPDGEYEKLHLIDVITTNKTDFFREPEHFVYLIDKALPKLERARRQNGRMDLNIWSAGCSTGEEPYTMAIVLNEATEKIPGLRFNIMATDISQTCLKTAKSGVYTEARIKPVPMELRRKYMLRSTDSSSQVVMMGPELKRQIRFASLNLMVRSFPIQKEMDAIFCRNVMIYFNNKIREELVNRFEKQLVPGGYLFIGHSESLGGMNTRLVQVAPMVYQKPLV